MAEPATDDFLAGLPLFASFGQIADPDLYAPVPEDWILGLADVVSSTAAIAAGRYKAVNMAGAAVIAAVSNALAPGRFPFVFGGDGASFAVSPRQAAAALDALAATATLVREEFDLTLRVAALPVSAIRSAGHDLRIARFAASPDVDYAMFAGGGLSWAEGRMKAGEFAVAPAPPGSRPDLTGLSCRFDAAPARHGVILSIIARPVADGRAGAFRALVEDILGLIEASPGKARPLPDGGPPLGWPSPGLDLEAALGRPLRRARWLHRLVLLARTAGSTAVLRFRIPVGRFEPTRYLDELVANSDYRKYDDGLRMTIDCAETLADAIERKLGEAAGRGLLHYGLHRQDAAIVTCITPAPTRQDHIHFVDGAAGGYAAAAAGMKGPAVGRI
jgi:hypothetical protein